VMSVIFQPGSRVYLANAVAGEPGIVYGFDQRGRVIVDWPDLNLGRMTHHDPESLIVDQQFKCKQFCLEFDKLAA